MMPIMRAVPSISNKTFKIPCSGEGIFVAVNTTLRDGSIAYWNGTSMLLIPSGDYCQIKSITVQDGVATVVVFNSSGANDTFTRVCFIPGDPLASN